MHTDINCDMGEGIGNDAAIMPFIKSANIACGYHAGNEETMRTTMLLATQHGVNIGVHPSFPDRENFGRKEMPCTPQELYHFVMKQFHLFQAIADECHVHVHHVKPHGALYNMAARDQLMAETFALAVKDFNGHLQIYGLSNSHLVSEAKKLGLPAKHEVFADRTYQDDGSLTPRSRPGALIEDEEKAVQQVLQMVQKKTVTTVTGKEISIHAETVCIHGDGKKAVQFAKAISTALHKL
jgi:5-oxoprolinase (ATP-hydrolysing) subunit A